MPTWMVPPSGLKRMALSSRLSRARCRRELSAETTAAASAGSTCSSRWMLRGSASGRRPIHTCRTSSGRSTGRRRRPSRGRVFSRRESSSRSPTSACRRRSSRCSRSTSTALRLLTWAARLSPTSSRAVSGVLSSWATSDTQRSCCSSCASSERRLCSSTATQPASPGSANSSSSSPGRCHSSRCNRPRRRASRTSSASSGASHTRCRGRAWSRAGPPTSSRRSARGLSSRTTSSPSMISQPVGAASSQRSSCAGARPARRRTRRRLRRVHSSVRTTPSRRPRGRARGPNSRGTGLTGRGQPKR